MADTPQPKQRLDFPANIALRTLKSKDNDQPTLAQIVTWEDRLPFRFVIETPDPTFLNELARTLTEIALEMSQNPLNQEFIGKHTVEDPNLVDADTLSTIVPAAAAGNSDAPAAEAEAQKGE